jgi:hypothetical protein
MNRTAAALCCMLLSTPVSAGELVWVGDRGLVDLDAFSCTEITTSNFLRRACYDQTNEYLVVGLGEKWRHYCEVSSRIAAAFLGAPSPASFYNSNIRSGPFDCKRKRMPKYED